MRPIRIAPVDYDTIDAVLPVAGSLAAPAHKTPRFPPSRLFGRLPPSPSSRPCPAGVRKPLT